MKGNPADNGNYRECQETRITPQEGSRLAVSFMAEFGAVVGEKLFQKSIERRKGVYCPVIHRVH